ncbi:tRNA dihydrouridine(20/20a) synthase DusA [Cupriavidus agavae]|uniref:tRNA-dihydrouridine(20/20a) synthase n=1 Tax=Cupriavidus agavae TaxID=1001822 RepID=A0A4Q7S7M9_9BURK|nr:tRNA dihydrouridine(20/20a) synthase DusA [Cupriavidus agavae]RZT41907.1 tRNA-U16,U17-dihydrouridine synthase [Cupriavidus agavae]
MEQTRSTPQTESTGGIQGNVRPRRISVAPMMDWTDRRCRTFHRSLSRHTWLYTEMVTTGALLHGDVPRHLDFDAAEHPVALQLGGSEPADLAQAARLGEQWGYKEINLNCGCPSERVQRGAFGACLMAEPQLVADCVKAMRDAVDVPVTVKHRIGIDKVEHYDFVRDFVGTVAEAGCETFIVHARNAILKGLSPKENREIPPLRYEVAYSLKKEFPNLEILINGGITSYDEIDTHLQYVDGVMLGRQAYHDPYILAEIDNCYYGADTPAPLRQDAESAMQSYIGDLVEQGGYMGSVTRHMLGLHRGIHGGRGWRRVLSDARRMNAAKTRADVDALFEEARSHLRPDLREAA